MLRRIYVGCSLAYASEEFRQRIEELRDILREDYEVFNFMGLNKGTHKETYQWDIHQCVKECDVFLAICDYPSIGLGYEMATAIEKLDKPVLAVAHQEAKLSRIILGNDTPSFSLQRYDDLLTDVPALLEKFISGSTIGR
jgi:hypothetical protein